MVNLSTPANATIVQRAGGVSGAAQDALRFTPSSLGSSTEGTWQMYFDGSDVGLSSSSENLSGVALDAAGQIHLVTTGNFSVTNRSGANEDVFFTTSFTPSSSTSAVFSSALFFDGSAFGLGSNSLTGIDLPAVEAGGMASAAALVLGGGSPVAAIDASGKKAASLLAREEMFASYSAPRSDLLAVLSRGEANPSKNSSTVAVRKGVEPERSANELALNEIFGTI